MTGVQTCALPILQALKQNYAFAQNSSDEPALASLKISGKPGGFLRLFSTHPDLDDRIERLQVNFGTIPRGAIRG